LKEYKETTEREQFLSTELADLTASTESLKTLIEELNPHASRFALARRAKNTIPSLMPSLN